MPFDWQCILVLHEKNSCFVLLYNQVRRHHSTSALLLPCTPPFRHPPSPTIPRLALVNYFVLFAVVTLVVQTFVFFVNPCKGKKELYALARRRDCHTPNDYKADMELVHKDTGFSDYLKDNFTTQEFERKRRASLNVKSADALHDEMSMEEAEQNGTGGAGPHTSSRLDDTNDSRMLVVTDEPSETKLGDVSEGA
mmetsp:Transcript_27116/g.73084  ORF Transcript_27116/g.73084 Transcript_27116/m.73084 type:complete len:195 (+) Transcript_27116:1305-1889(+)